MIAYLRAFTNNTSTKGEGKTKTAVSQMKERGSGLKPTSGEFMESVLETRKEMIVHNDLCNLLAWPSRKSVSKLTMLPHRYLDEMGHTSYSSWKGIISAILQEAESPPTFSKKPETMLYTFMYPEEYTLTESNSKTDSHSSTSGEEELDDSEDEDECQRKLY